MARKLTLLGKTGVKKPTKLLESFPCPANCVRVKMTSDEVTALCPVTGQPDQYTVEIDYVPDRLCIESKSLKLELHALRQKGIFCESLSTFLVKRVVDSIKPKWVSVAVIQKPRGGVSIRAVSESGYSIGDE